MNICCFLIEPWQKEILELELKDHNLKIFSEALNLRNIEEIKDTEIIVSRAKNLDLKFDSETLEKLPNLKFISTMSAGFDHIDVDYCKRKGILVSNVPYYGKAVAEYTFAMILSILKKIPLLIESLRKGLKQNFQGFNLSGKTIGVIGSGKIGLDVIEIARGFNMKILSYDVIINQEASEELGFSYVGLNELLRESDIITLHVPFNKHTYHLLNENNLNNVKKGCIIINTSRGEVIDNECLLKCLKDKTVYFAGLDVVEDKIVSRLLELDNVFITPHNASNTKEAKKLILKTTIENILGFINKTPKNLIFQN